MAFKTKDGRSFGSAYVARKKDRMHDLMSQAMEPEQGESKQHEASETPEFEAGEQEGMKEASKSENPVVKQHGKATRVQIKHDHVAGKHHVTSVHEDGHVNEQDFPTAHDAHDAGMSLSEAYAQPEEEDVSGGAPEANTETGNVRSMPRFA